MVPSAGLEVTITGLKLSTCLCLTKSCLVPPERFELPITGSKPVVISPPVSLVPPERFELPTTGSKPVMISISTWGLGNGGQAFHHGGKAQLGKFHFYHQGKFNDILPE